VSLSSRPGAPTRGTQVGTRRGQRRTTTRSLLDSEHHCYQNFCSDYPPPREYPTNLFKIQDKQRGFSELVTSLCKNGSGGRRRGADEEEEEAAAARWGAATHHRSNGQALTSGRLTCGAAPICRVTSSPHHPKFCCWRHFRPGLLFHQHSADFFCFCFWTSRLTFPQNL
jgi:hypothetical protein